MESGGIQHAEIRQSHRPATREFLLCPLNLRRLVRHQPREFTLFFASIFHGSRRAARGHPSINVHSWIAPNGLRFHPRGARSLSDLVPPIESLLVDLQMACRCHSKRSAPKPMRISFGWGLSEPERQCLPIGETVAAAQPLIVYILQREKQSWNSLPRACPQDLRLRRATGVSEKPASEALPASRPTSSFLLF